MRPLFLFIFISISTALTAQVVDSTMVDSTAAKPPAPRVVKDTVTLVGVGDIMMGTNYPESMLPPDDGAFLMKDVEPYLNDADVTFGNLEGTLLDSGGTPKT